jgi:hypothetical protein
VTRSGFHRPGFAHRRAGGATPRTTAFDWDQALAAARWLAEAATGLRVTTQEEFGQRLVRLRGWLGDLRGDTFPLPAVLARASASGFLVLARGWCDAATLAEPRTACAPLLLCAVDYLEGLRAEQKARQADQLRAVTGERD